MEITNPLTRRNWTKEEDKLLTDAYQQHQTRSSRMAALRKVSALDRTESSIETRAFHLGPNRNGNKKQSVPVRGSEAQATKLGFAAYRPWTQEEDSLLTTVRRQYTDWVHRESEFNEKSVISRTRRAMIKRVLFLDLKSGAPKACTVDEDEFLQTAMKQSNDWGIVLEKFHDKFGSARSLFAMKRRLLRVGDVVVNERVVWAEEEIDFLRTRSPSTSYQVSAQEFAKKFQNGRSIPSIVHKMQRLLEQDGTRENRVPMYSEEEAALLRNLKPADSENDDWLARYHRKFGPSRSRKALVEKWRRETAQQDLPNVS